MCSTEATSCATPLCLSCCEAVMEPFCNTTLLQCNAGSLRRQEEGASGQLPSTAETCRWVKFAP